MGEEYMHSVYRNRSRQTTLWDDAQRKHGNLPELEPEWKPDEFSPASEQTAAERIAAATSAGQLEELEVGVNFMATATL